MMKKFRVLLSLAALLMTAALSLGLTARAEQYHGGENWQVTLGENQRMTSNFTSEDIDKVMSALEPGDTATFTVTIIHDNKDITAWYVSNKILYSLEDRSDTAAGGAYEYELIYTAPDGTDKVIYSSDVVGGEGSEDSGAGEGLHGADSALKDFFYLDKLSKGQQGKVTLRLKLDGESQGNSYQDTMADLKINFAAEFDNGTIETGDHSQLLLWVALFAVSSCLLAVLVIRRMKSGRKGAAV